MTVKVTEAPGANEPAAAQYGLPWKLPLAFVALTLGLLIPSTSSIGPAIVLPLVFVTVIVSVPVFAMRLYTSADDLNDTWFVTFVAPPPPVPLRFAVYVPAEVFVVTVSVPARGPEAVGVNTTLMLHVAPASSVAPQSWLSEKSPVVAMFEIAIWPSPLLVSTNTDPFDELPTLTVPNAPFPLSVAERTGAGIVKYPTATS